MLDKTLPYFNVIMRRPKAAKIPNAPILPEGYRFVDYKGQPTQVAEHFHKSWASILTEVLEFDTTQEAMSYLKLNYLTHPKELEKRQFFVATDHGDLVATLTNWWHDSPTYEPSVHWVAVSPSHQGKGIGRALVEEGMRRMVALEGDRDYYLHTQNWSYAAIGLYLEVGYIIEPTDTFGSYQNDYHKAMESMRNLVRIKNHKNTSQDLFIPLKELAAERLKIVAFGPQHVLPAIEHLNTQEVRRYLGGVKPRDIALDAFNRIALGEGASTGIHLAVELSCTGAFIGYISLDSHHDHHAPELSFVFASSAWGRGYATEALLEVLCFCKHTLLLESLVSETQVANIPSNQLLDRIGFHKLRDLERFGERQNLYRLHLNDYIPYLRHRIKHAPVNLPGVNVVIFNEAEEVLLQKRGDFPYKWGLLGGICELGESYEDAAIREIFEESGIILKKTDLKLIGTKSGANCFMRLPNGDQAFFMTTVFAALVNNQTFGTPDGIETLQLEFYAKEAIPQSVPKTHREMLEMFYTSTR